MKKEEFCHFWVESHPGTGTKKGWYRYHLCSGKMVPVPLSKTGLVPAPNIVVPVPLVPATPVFGIFT